MKICNKLTLTPICWPLTTPINIAKLLSLLDEKEVSDTSRILYQKKVSSLSFVATDTRPDIAFAVFRLSRFNQQPGKTHHKEVDQVFNYLFWTQDYYTCQRKNIRYFVFYVHQWHFICQLFAGLEELLGLYDKVICWYTYIAGQ